MRRNVAIVDKEVRYPVLLADGDEHFVTADSVSMISEAVVTGKPVGLIPVEPDARGRRRLGPDPEIDQDPRSPPVLGRGRGEGPGRNRR